MLIFGILTALAGTVSGGIVRPRDLSFSQSSRNPALNANFGAASQLSTVSAGVTAWLSGGSTHNFFGNLDNYGTIVVSQTDFLKQYPFTGGQSSYFTAAGALGGNLNNHDGAFISLNDFGSASAPSYYWNLETMKNFGGIQFCGRGDTGGSTYWLTCRQSCTNNGLIDFGQYTRNLGGAFYWRNAVAGDSTTVTNDGTFRLTNVVFHNTQNIYGSGCWVLNAGAVLYLEDGTGVIKNPSRGPSFPGQKIYFAESDSTIHMDTAVYSGASDFGAEVFGFGQGKAIEFYQTITSFTYANGILGINFGSNLVRIKIGFGYDPSLFSKVTNVEHYGSWNAIAYNGPTPAQNIPSVCSAARATCANPEVTGGVTSTTTTTTTTTTTATSTSKTSSSVSTTTTTTLTTTTPRSTITTNPPTTTTTTTTRPASTTTIAPSTSTTRSTASATSTTTKTANTTTRPSTATTFKTTTASTEVSTATTRPTTTAKSSTTLTTTATVVTALTTTSSGMISQYPATTSLATPLPTCGIAGYDLQQPAAFDGTNSNEASYSFCRNYCSTKLSVSFAAGNNQCLCYTAPVSGNLSPVPSSPYIFYDISCPLPTGSPLTTKPVTLVTTTSTISYATTTSTQPSSAPGICAGGAQPSSTYVAANGDVYGICLNTEFPQGGLKTIGGISTIQLCAEQCSKTEGCIASTLQCDSKVCYLKTDRSGAIVNPGTDSAYRISSGGYSTSY